MLKNKKADSTLLYPWMFFVLGLIGIAILFGTIVFFSGSADVRLREAKAISDKLVYSISDNGYLKPEVINDIYNIVSEADLNSKAFLNSGFFYFNLSIYKNEIPVKSFLKGNADFEIQCRLTGDKLAKCYEREFILLNKLNPSEIFKIKILAGSNNRGN